MHRMKHVKTIGMVSNSPTEPVDEQMTVTAMIPQIRGEQPTKRLPRYGLITPSMGRLPYGVYSTRASVTLPEHHVQDSCSLRMTCVTDVLDDHVPVSAEYVRVVDVVVSFTKSSPRITP